MFVYILAISSILCAIPLVWYVYSRFKCKVKIQKLNEESRNQNQPKLGNAHPSPTIETSVYIVTWNVNTKQPDISLNDLLGLDNDPEYDLQRPDFYIIGLQEINSQPKSVAKAHPWAEKFKELLKIRGYVAVKSEQMQGLLVILFTKRQHLLHIRQVGSHFTRTGLGGLWGNKGAVSIRFSLYGCSVCIVNAHLAAHDDALEERIKDYTKIVEEHKTTALDIFAHDYVFWFGDLNFRLATEYDYSPQRIQNLIQHNHFRKLIAIDQLSLVKERGSAFTHLDERQPTFPPTFKFQLGTSEYDLKPAWTDRVLYKTPKNADLSIEQISYRSHPEYKISDHKPVTSEFIMKVSMDLTEKIIEFAPISDWKNGENNVIEYVLPDGYEKQENDWIGLFEENFDSLSDHIKNEYTNRSKVLSADESSQTTVYSLAFPAVNLSKNHQYVLLYIQCDATRSLTGLVGISDTFEAKSP